MEENELIKRCKQNDRLAQELLYSRYADRLYNIAFRYTKNQNEAEDVLIIALNKVFLHIGNFQVQTNGNLMAWLKKIVVNEALMCLRKRHNFNITETLNENANEASLSVVAENEPEDIYNAIALLPLGYRTVFNLYIIEGYSHEEIADLLNISQGTSRSQLFKAKAILKKTLNEEGFNYGT